MKNLNERSVQRTLDVSHRSLVRVGAASGLQEGARGDSVRTAQARLNQRGASLVEDGIFGPKTRAAVQAFQRENGLPTTGVIDAATEQALARPAPAPVPGATKPGRTVGTIGDSRIVKVDGKNGVAFRSGMTINADGSPNAYNPRNTGLDDNRNAGKNGKWWGIATDSNGRPYIQGPNDPSPGNYVSTTALQDGRYSARDPRRYLDSEKIPFIAVPPELRAYGVKLGDVVAVKNERNGKIAYAVVGDIGPHGQIGEGSIALARALGIDANARHGGQASNVSYVVFPGTAEPTWAQGQGNFDARAREALANYGGTDQLDRSLRR